MLIYKEV